MVNEASSGRRLKWRPLLKFNIRKYFTLIIYLGVSLGLSLSFSCGEPIGPGQAHWEVIAPVPMGYFGMVTPYTGKYPQTFYACVNPTPWFEYPFNKGIAFESEGPKIYRYDVKQFKFVEVYEHKGTGDPIIYDVAVGKDGYTTYGWACGGQGEWNYNRPTALLLNYDGREWREVVLTPPYERPFATIELINNREVWLVSGKLGPQILSAGGLYKYGSGTLNYYDEVGSVYGVKYAAGTGFTYVGSYQDGPAVYISPDRGQTWIKETPEEAVPGYDLQYCWPVWVEGDAVYFCAAYTRDAYGLLVRTGAPGMGEYRLLFLSDTGPNFFELRTAAVDGQGRILAAGADTTVIYDDGVWYTEEDPCPRVFYRVWAAGSQGWYGVAENGVLNRVELLYHP